MNEASVELDLKRRRLLGKGVAEFDNNDGRHRSAARKIYSCDGPSIFLTPTEGIGRSPMLPKSTCEFRSFTHNSAAGK